MRSDETTDRNPRPFDRDEADADLAALFERTVPAAPAVDVDRLLASLESRSVVRESPEGARASRPLIVPRTAFVPFSTRRIRMITKVAAVLLLATPVAVMLLLFGPGRHVGRAGRRARGSGKRHVGNLHSDGDCRRQARRKSEGHAAGLEALSGGAARRDDHDP